MNGSGGDSATTFSLGPLAVRVTGDHPATPWAARTFAPLATAAAPDLTFEFTPSPLDIPADHVGDETFKVGEDAVFFRMKLHDAVLRAITPAGAPRRWIMTLRRRDRRPLWLRSVTDPVETWKMWLSHGASLDMHLLKEFCYTAAPLAMECALLERRASLIHASGFALDGRGVLLPAWGGTGKSTVVSQCVLHGRAQFLADDHAVIDSTGAMHLHLLPIHAYSYHAKQDATLRDRLLAAHSPMNRLQWKFACAVRPKRAVRWVSPTALFGAERLERSASINHVIVMFRGTQSEFRFEKVSPAEAARPCAGVIAEEINGFTARLALASAGWATPLLPDPGAAYQSARQVYENAFASAQCARLMVPKKANTSDLMTFLRRECPIIAEASKA